MPNPTPNESKKEFLKKYMSSPEAIKDFPNASQRYAVAESEWEKVKNEMPGQGSFPSGSSAYIPELVKKKDAERRYKR